MRIAYPALTFDLVTVSHDFLDQSTWRYKNHAQDFVKIYLVKSGAGRVRYPDKSIELTPGRLYFIPPLKPADYFVTVTPLEKYWAHFYAKFAGHLSLFSLMEFNESVPVADMDAVTGLFERLRRIFERRFETSAAFEADAILRYLLASLKKDVDKDPEAVTRESKRFEPAIRYLEENLAERTDIKKLAALVHLHPTYFSNAFSKTFGVSPSSFAISKRLEKARELLFFTDASIKQIAAKVGFDDEFYFSRAFKKYVGMPPTEYRARKKI